MAVVRALHFGVLALLVTGCRTTTDAPAANDVRLVALQPPVFVTFEKFGPHSPRDETESTAGVWLRLHNNSRWPISIDTSCTKTAVSDKSFSGFGGSPARVLPESTPVEFSYIHYHDPREKQLTAGDLRKPEYQGAYENNTLVMCEEWLLPGASVLFSVATEALLPESGRSVTVNFEFPWLNPPFDYRRMNPSPTRTSVSVYSGQIPCTQAANNSSTITSTNPRPTQSTLTGTWQAQVDGGNRTVLLQYILIEDAGTLSGRKLVNDPLYLSEFHTIDSLIGTHRNETITLQTITSGDTFTATFDGGVLAGVDPYSRPLIFRDAGFPQSLNVPFTMTRISTDAPIPDAGDFQ